MLKSIRTVIVKNRPSAPDIQFRRLYKTGAAHAISIPTTSGSSRKGSNAIFLESRRVKSNTSFERADFQTNFARTMGAIEHSYQKLCSKE